MNNNIEETIVSFSVTKLLKEVVFYCPCTHFYVLDFNNFKSTGIVRSHFTPDHGENILQKVSISKLKNRRFYSIPMQAAHLWGIVKLK